MATILENGNRATLAELKPEPRGSAGVSIARLTGFDENGRCHVALSATGDPVVARSTVQLAPTDIGMELVVAYEGNDVGNPIIIGRVQEPIVSRTRDALIDGRRLVIRAEREIELKCGDASITLTRAGKVLIRGRYVLSRSRGANKIKGAFVAIN